jgi:hypothetical protein
MRAPRLTHSERERAERLADDQRAVLELGVNQ